MNTNEIQIPEEVLLKQIHEIKGMKVMLDPDLADLYQVETKRLNEQVKRNRDRFPPDFMFQLTQIQWDSLQSQIATTTQNMRRSLPYVFTEQGIAMLSGVLKSKMAIKVHIQIIQVSTKIRGLHINQKELYKEMEKIRHKVNGQDQKIETFFNYLKQFIKDQSRPRKRVGFK